MSNVTFALIGTEWESFLTIKSKSNSLLLPPQWHRCHSWVRAVLAREVISFCSLTCPSFGLTPPSSFSIVAYSSGLSLSCRHLLIGVVCFLGIVYFLGWCAYAKEQVRIFKGWERRVHFGVLSPCPSAVKRIQPAPWFALWCHWMVWLHLRIGGVLQLLLPPGVSESSLSTLGW